jgi:hypothetical protein
MIVDLGVCYLQLQWYESCTGRQAKPLKSLPGTHRPDSIRAPCRSAGFGIASGGRILFLRVSNFAQTADVRSANFPGDGRVAQSAERVCEQHETVVRNHSPRRQPPPTLTKRLRSAGPNEPTRALPRLMIAAVLAGPGGSDACPEIFRGGRRPDGGRPHGVECPHGAVRLGLGRRGDACLERRVACHRPAQAGARGRTGGGGRPAGGREACSGLASFLPFHAGPTTVPLTAAPSIVASRSATLVPPI